MKGWIRLDDVTVGYRRHPAVHHLTGEFAPGSLTAIVGPNGGGKTTLLKALVGLLRPDAGRIVLPPPGRDAIAYLPQQAELDRGFPIGVLDVVQLGHWRRAGPFGAIDAGMRRAALAALELVGLAGFERRPIGSLSTGQLQRVLFARLMVEDCPIVLLDEPFAAVDARTTDDLLRVIAGWHAEGRTVVAVLHDLAQVRAAMPRTLLLARRAIAWGPTPAVLTAPNLMRAWGMAQAWDEQAALCRVKVPA